MKQTDKRYRNEWKYLISRPEAELLRRRLSPFMQTDVHAAGGEYMIRSLYFDDRYDSAYRDKIAGVQIRKKWRVRVYNCSDEKISLERKLKNGSYILKEALTLSREELDRLLSGDPGFLLKRGENLGGEFYYDWTVEGLRPKVIVDYERVPLVFEPGNVRITFDRDVRAAVGGMDLFDPALPTLPAIEPEKLVLEVKYTELLPRQIQTLLPADGQEFSAFSKYAACYEAAHALTDPTAGLSKSSSNWRTRLCR